MADDARGGFSPIGFGMQGLGLLMSLGQRRGQDRGIRRFKSEMGTTISEDMINRLKLVSMQRRMSQARAGWGSMGQDTYDPMRQARLTSLGEAREVAPFKAQQMSEHDALVRQLNDRLQSMKLERERSGTQMLTNFGRMF